MDTVALVEDLVDDGRRLLDRLAQEDVEVLAAAWVKPIDEDRWSLYIATPAVDEGGPLAAYRAVNRALRGLGASEVTASEVKLIGGRHPITADLLDILHKYPGRTPTRSRRPMLGGVPVEETYLYPPAEPTLKGFDEIKRKFPSAEVFTVTVPGPKGVPFEQAAALGRQYLPLVGKVNAAEFEGKPAETLLFMGPKLSNKKVQGKLVFVHRPEGWNTFYRDETGTWERVVFASTGNPLYELADFSPLAALKSETA